jgi:ABC-2 type transport system permease protein
MFSFLQQIAGLFIRISAFITKEFFSVLSQPRLLGVLILGPFLILFIFGVSYQNAPRTLRTSVVILEDSQIEADVEAFENLPIHGIEITNISYTQNTTGALSALKNQRVDLVLIIPPNIDQIIEDNQQAVFTFYHQEIDPFEIAYVEIVAERITEETNRNILLSAVEKSKEEARVYQTEIHNFKRLSDDPMQSNEQDGQGAENNVELLDTTTGLWLLIQAAEKWTNFSPVENHSNPQSSGSDQTNLLGLDFEELDLIDAQITKFIDTNSQVIIEPYRYETHGLSEVDIKPVHFYVPAVLALLLQHIAVSLAGLSIVKERFAGTMELLRAAPVNPFEVLLGKYLSFLFFIGFVAVLLSFLVHWVLGVPLAGSLPLYALVICLIILVSLGFGFLISNFARSDSQAIQFSMVLLLASIFFSGFFLSLYLFKWPAQVISWLLPATYGLEMLQDIMLRGIQPDEWLFLVLGGFAAVLFVANWFRLRTLMVQD